MHVLDLALVLLAYARPEQVLANIFDHLGRAGSQGLLGSWYPARFSVENVGTAYLVFPGNHSGSLTAAFVLNYAEDKHLQLRAHGTRGGATLFPLVLHTEVAGELADVRFRPYRLPTGSWPTRWPSWTLVTADPRPSARPRRAPSYKTWTGSTRRPVSQNRPGPASIGERQASRRIPDY